MKRIRIFVIIFIGVCVITACKKPPVPQTSSANSQLGANANNTVLVFNGSASQTSTDQFLISGTTGTGVKLVISFSAAGTGTVKIGTPTYGGQATFTSASGEVWATDFADSGFVYVNTFNTTTNNIAGTFYFTGNEIKPTPNASTLAVSSGSFDLTW